MKRPCADKLCQLQLQIFPAHADTQMVGYGAVRELCRAEHITSCPCSTTATEEVKSSRLCAWCRMLIQTCNQSVSYGVTRLIQEQAACRLTHCHSEPWSTLPSILTSQVGFPVTCCRRCVLNVDRDQCTVQTECSEARGSPQDPYNRNQDKHSCVHSICTTLPAVCL